MSHSLKSIPICLILIAVSSQGDALCDSLSAWYMLGLFKIDKMGMVKMSVIFSANVSHFLISTLLYSYCVSFFFFFFSLSSRSAFIT